MLPKSTQVSIPKPVQTRTPRTSPPAFQSLPSLASTTTPSQATNAQSELSANLFSKHHARQPLKDHPPTTSSLNPEGTLKKYSTRSQSKEVNKSQKERFDKDAGTTSPKEQSKNEKPARRSSSGDRIRSPKGRNNEDAGITSPKRQSKSEKRARRSSSRERKRSQKGRSDKDAGTTSPKGQS